MTLSIDGHSGDVSRRVTYLSASSPAGPGFKCKQTEETE